MALNAGRDVNVSAVQVENSVFQNAKHNTSDVTQLGADIDAGRDFKADAKRDINVIASQIDAKRDVAMTATENMLISSAADEEHSLSKSKKVTRQEDHVSQVMSGITAGGDVSLAAGQNLAVVSSRVTAGDEAYLVAGDRLDILAAQDRDYSLYDMKKKGSFGAKKMRHDEVTQITHVGSEIKAGGDLSLISRGDQLYQVATLESGKDITLESGGTIVFEGVKDLHDESHTKSNGDAFWTSSKGRGNTDETLRQSHLIAAGNLSIKAVEGLKVDIKHINQQSVSQTIDAMVKADPQLAWLKQAEMRGDIDWRQVKEIHESFKYENSGLGPASQLIIAIALAAVMGPAMAGISTMLQSVAVNVATTATVSTINNRGNLGRVLKDVTSKEAIKSYAVSAASAGVAQGLNYNPGSMGFNAESYKLIAMKVGADALIKTAVYGGSFKDNLASSAAGTAASIGGAIGAGKIGDLDLADISLTKIALHAGLGGLLAEAMGGDFRTGAIAGGANEVLVGLLGETLLPSNYVMGSPEYIQAQANILALSQIVGVLGATLSGGDVGTAAAVAANATQYNFLGDHAKAKRDQARERFNETHGIEPARQLVELEGSDHRSDNLLDKYRTDYGSMTYAERAELNAYLQVYSADMLSQPGATKESVEGVVLKLLKEGPTTSGVYLYAGTTEAKNASADAMRAQLDGWFDQLGWTRPKTENELVYKNAQGYLRINNEQQGLSNLGSPAIYGLTGPLGTSIRMAAAASGVLQIGAGGKQALNGDLWNAAGNIVTGALAVAGAGLPGVRLSGSSAIDEVSVVNPKPGSTLGAKEIAVISSGAASVNAQAALRAKLSGLKKAQETAAVTKTLPDGRIRYYTQEVPARTEGATRGASFATEYNPTTGSTRQWMESYDHSGSVIRVHPKSINGQPVSAQHYPPTGAELKSWK